MPMLLGAVLCQPMGWIVTIRRRAMPSHPAAAGNVAMMQLLLRAKAAVNAEDAVPGFGSTSEI